MLRINMKQLIAVYSLSKVMHESTGNSLLHFYRLLSYDKFSQFQLLLYESLFLSI